MSPKPNFATVGDEPIEARIVAWVLGDASAFEATELERLCNERPELLVFRRRMRALHSLLTEAESADPDHSAKLPPEKRRTLDEIFGAESAGKRLEMPQQARVRRRWPQRILAVAACLALLVGVAAVFAPASVHMRRKSSEVASSASLASSYPPEGLEGTPGTPIVLDASSPAAKSAKVALHGELTPGDAAKKNLEAAPELAANAKRMSEEFAFQEESLPADDVDQATRPNRLADDRAVAAKSPQPSAPVKMRLSSDLADASGERVIAESTGSDYAIREEVDRFATTPALPAADSPVGGVGSAHGFGAVHTLPPLPALEAKKYGPGFGAATGSASGLADGKGQASALQLQKSSGIGGALGGPGARSGSEDRGKSGDGAAAENRSSGTLAGEPPVGAARVPAKPQAAATPAPLPVPTLAKNKESSASVSGASIDALLKDFAGKPQAAPPATPAAAPAAITLSDNLAAAKSAATEPGIEDAEMSKARSDENTLGGKNAYTDDTTVTNGTLGLKQRQLDAKAAADANPTKLAGLVEGEKLRRQSAVVDSDRYIVEARDAFTQSNYQQAYDNYAKALALLPEMPATKERRGFLRKSLGDAAVALANDAIKDGKNDQAKDWLAKAVDWDPDNQAARREVVADVASETTATDRPYSTFSLSISDASFKMARAALARGERPEPSSIKTEQFYNAVDYGDPLPGPGEAVAGRVEQAAHPVIPGRNLLRVAMRTGAAGRNPAQPLRLTLLVDQSGSMARDDRRAAMALALKQLAGLLTKNDRVTVIGFARSPRLLADALSGDQGAKLNEVVNQAASEGGTNLAEAMNLGEQMALRHLTAGAQNRIVLFTDGAANLGDADPSRLADKVSAMRQKGLSFDIAGIGTSNLNDQLLAELARHGNGRYCVVGAEKDADGSFARQLAGAFRPAAENVKVQVRFNPQRVGRYKLLGFEEHRLKTEDFRNDAVDAAELAAEEAGVALYQVEPLAEGSGELGEASVRFRDAASGQMVERTWTIPYEASAPAFDRATPSLQLAGLALLAAEKLRGGPLAEAIDFKQFAAARATVKQFYSNSRRVAEMLEMVNRL